MQEHDNGQSSPQISRWNTWTLRVTLKAAAGLCFAGIAFPLVLVLTGGDPALYQGSALVAFAAGIILWSIFYYLEMEYRRAYPDRLM